MHSHDKKVSNLFSYWLTGTLALVFTTIIIGGLTRLTDSGLSITEWELFKGILPPLSNESWNNYFNLYKEIPQYKILNSNMSLQEFKVIFYWEYFHRVLGRVIGIFFLLPLIYFHIKKKIHKNFFLPCYIILFLIITQGVVGWFMVKSGLVNDVTVSHYRLSLHLTIAIIIISIIFWLLLNLKNNTNLKFFLLKKSNAPFLILILFIFFQIILGAFVSGLDAGKIYQTWPLMGYTYLPDDLIFTDIKNLIDFENHSLIQFYHRNLAYFLTLYILAIAFFVFRFGITKLYKSIFLILFFLLIQITLGILTLTSGLNIYLASGHQITSVLLVFTAINLYYSYIK
jgi:cytochrome c oxidase assembly protein subunit 15